MRGNRCKTSKRDILVNSQAIDLVSSRSRELRNLRLTCLARKGLQRICLASPPVKLPSPFWVCLAPALVLRLLVGPFHSFYSIATLACSLLLMPWLQPGLDSLKVTGIDKCRYGKANRPRRDRILLGTSLSPLIFKGPSNIFIFFTRNGRADFLL